jgi:molybdenum cofactor cytidylyltransferase
MNLVEAIEPELPARIAIVGGGGKTTALFQLGRQLPGRVWLSTTTHLGTDQLGGADRHFIVNTVDENAIQQWLQQRVTLLTGEFTPDDRVKGPGNEALDRIFQAARARGISLVIEADGSRSRPLKAPGENEPATPALSEVVITVVGLSVVGKPFSEATVHRVEPFKMITGLELGEIITLNSIAKVLIHPLGGLKNAPTQARKIALLNQADTNEIIEQTEKIIPSLLAGGYERVIVGSLQKEQDRLICFGS